MKAQLENTIRALARLHREDAGQDLIEYALVAALIALAAVSGMKAVANSVNSAFLSVASKLNSAAH